MTKVFKKIKSLFPSGFEATKTPVNKEASFLIKYNSLLIGKLSLKSGKWYFQYSLEFKDQKEVNPLREFPELDKTYQSDTLWPFFVVRIPSIQQPKIQKIISKEGIDYKDQVALLKRFGGKTISNPFTLIAC